MNKSLSRFIKEFLQVYVQVVGRRSRRWGSIIPGNDQFFAIALLSGWLKRVEDLAFQVTEVPGILGECKNAGKQYSGEFSQQQLVLVPGLSRGSPVKGCMGQ